MVTQIILFKKQLQDHGSTQKLKLIRSTAFSKNQDLNLIMYLQNRNLNVFENLVLILKGFSDSTILYRVLI